MKYVLITITEPEPGSRLHHRKSGVPKKMKNLILIPAALIALGLAGGAQAAALAAPAAHVEEHVTVVTTRHQATLLPAGYAANPANGAFADNDNEEAQPDPHAKDAAQVDAAAAPVPEPQTFLMMLIGLVLLGLASSRRETYEKFTD
jgi:hypothetical protein